MSDRYYQIYDDAPIPQRWFLKTVVDSNGSSIHPGIFRRGEALNFAEPLTIGFGEQGPPLKLSLGAYDMPVADEDTGFQLKRSAPSSVQLIQARVQGFSEPFWVLNVLDSCDCVDEAASEFIKWTRRDGRPDKVGQFRQISKMRIDPSRVNGLKIFRIKGWSIALIVSEIIKQMLEKSGTPNLCFSPVTD